MEGVSRDVAERMGGVKATVLTEDNLCLRVCEHGIAHPVGHLSRSLDFDKQTKGRHFRVPSPSGADRCACDGCCEAYGVTYESEPTVQSV